MRQHSYIVSHTDSKHPARQRTNQHIINTHRQTDKQADRETDSWPSGSDQSRSHIGPSCGTSCLRSIALIWSSVWIDGDRPPCTQNI